MTLLALFGLVAIVAGAVVVGAVALASRSKAEYLASNQLLPGVPTAAPEAWAGSHDPEAVLHRRLRDALAALRSNQQFDDDGGLLDLRVDLEHQAQTIDDRLIAVAALPPHLRGEPLGQVTADVVLVEQAVSELAMLSGRDARAALEANLERIHQRTTFVADARTSLEDQHLRTDPPAAPTEQDPPPMPQPGTA